MSGDEDQKGSGLRLQPLPSPSADDKGAAHPANGWEEYKQQVKDDYQRLPARIEHVWNTKNTKLRRSLVQGLIKHLYALGFLYRDKNESREWENPSTNLRFLRLLAREYRAFDGDESELAWTFRTAKPLPLTHELGQLIVELASSGAEDFSALLPPSSTLWPAPAQVSKVAPEVGIRLVELAKRSRGSRRSLLLSWMKTGDWPESLAFLREEARSRVFQHRCAAFQALDHLNALQAADIAQGVEDLFEYGLPPLQIHGPNWTRILQTTFDKAIARLRPVEAAATLFEIARGRGWCAHEEYFEPRWALRNLSLVDHARAEVVISQHLATDAAWLRKEQIANILQLPDDKAEPLLRRLLDDPSFETADAARKAYSERFPEHPIKAWSAGPAEAILDEAPSEFLLSHLRRITSDPAEKDKVFEELWRAPDCKESLVLLVRLGSDDHLETFSKEKFPFRVALVERLFTRFGPLALQAMALAAADIPVGGGGWTESLLAFHKTQPLPEDVLQTLADGLIAQLRVLDNHVLRAVVEQIDEIGHTARAWRVLFEILERGDRASLFIKPALKDMPPHPEFDEWLKDELLGADKRGDRERVSFLAGFVVQRLPDFAASLVHEGLRESRILEEEWLGFACMELAASGKLALEPFLDALEDPESKLFDLAMRVFDHCSENLPPEAEERLQRLLDRSPDSASARAAAVLVHANRLPPDDPRIFELVAYAPPNAAARLLLPISIASEKPGLWGLSVTRALQNASDEDNIMGAYASLIGMKKSWSTFLRKIEPTISAPKIRKNLAQGIAIADGSFREDWEDYWEEG